MRYIAKHVPGGEARGGLVELDHEVHDGELLRRDELAHEAVDMRVHLGLCRRRGLVQVPQGRRPSVVEAGIDNAGSRPRAGLPGRRRRGDVAWRPRIPHDRLQGLEPVWVLRELGGLHCLRVGM